MLNFEITALWLTLKLASLTTIILLIVGAPFAWWLARYQGKFKAVIETLVALPLVLPPTVLGFYLLIAFAPDTWLGNTWFWLSGNQLAFSFSGILFASLIYSLPFVIQPLLASFSQFGLQYDRIAAGLGLSPLKRLVLVSIPITKPAIISATTLGFAHTLGEFGLVLMIGGNIPGETQVLSIALYNHVEAMEYQQAHSLSAILIALSFVCLFLLYRFNQPILLQDYNIKS
ncbi:molybdate ABC transporter permease subunit [Colwellia sp. MEBiC06753]